MKTIILLGDGMADEPLDSLGGRTPLEVADTPYMDKLAARGTLGMVRTVREGFPPGSDVANMTVLGLDPQKYYSGRAPIEAVSIGIDMAPTDTAFRINMVTVSPRGESLIMEDYCSDHITTEESAEILTTLKEAFATEADLSFYTGTEYRHILIIKGYENPSLKTTPPHDILGEPIAAFRPNDARLNALIERSMEILKDHPVNLKRRKEGKREATAIWPWGEGRGYSVPTLEAEYGVRGSMISAVDLLKGLGKLRGMEIINVPGATGWIDTNYTGKAEAAVDALSRTDLVYVHVEAPDEAGHGGLVQEKIRAIEDFDELVVGQILPRLEELYEHFRVLFLPDHPTPLAKRTHTSNPVPFVLYDNLAPQKNSWKFTEREAQATGVFVDEGHSLIQRLLDKTSAA